MKRTQSPKPREVSSMTHQRYPCFNIQEAQKVGDSTTVNALPPLIKRVKPVSPAIVDSLKKNSAYKTLRSEWAYQKNEGKRLKK